VPQSKRRWQRPLTILVGAIFILLGLVGLVLPILQGVLFLLIGLVLLARELPFAARLLHRVRARFPRLAAKVDQAESYVGRLGRRLRDRWRRR
jgi:uncharacterized membrane protein YbaN (DUF454 family)